MSTRNDMYAVQQRLRLAPACPYCDRKTKLVGGIRVYPHREDLHGLSFWLCEDCGAYCGCHRGTHKPLGTPANAELRNLRKQAHSKFDPFWRSGKMTRTEAYERLAKKMGIDIPDCHIGMFNEDQCREVLTIIGDKKP